LEKVSETDKMNLRPARDFLMLVGGAVCSVSGEARSSHHIACQTAEFRHNFVTRHPAKLPSHRSTTIAQ
jgi:hypothetical protein